MDKSGRDQRAFKALGSSIITRAAVETLELRRLLHAGHDHAIGANAAVDGSNPDPSGHMTESQFRVMHPELASANLWDPAVFNPTNSQLRSNWIYDPHAIEAESIPEYEDLPLVSSPEAVQLPDLVPLTAGSYLDPFIDTTEIPGHNLMRFSTAVGNAGTGPAILRSANTGTPPAGSGISTWINPDGSQNVLQQVYNWTGSAFTLDHYRQAGRMVWHSGHGHFHLEGYANYRLLTNVGGQPGPVAMRTNFDNQPAVGDKVGFCLINISDNFTIPATGQSSTGLQGFNAGGQPSTSCGFVQGIHVGKADVYSSIYDGQWIDVTGVPNGNYFLEVTLDALNVIEESDEVNNTVLVPYTLTAPNNTGGTILPDRYEPNNSFTEATDLGELGVQTQPGLTAHISGEQDYFRFTAASSGNYSVQLVISDRDVNLYLFDSAQTLLRSATNEVNATSSNPATKTINYDFVAGQTYFVKAVGFGSNINQQNTSGVSANYALKVNVNPTVNASAQDGQAGELGLNSGTIRLARNGPSSSPLLVNFTVGGTATRGVDYEVYFDDVLVTGNSVSIGNEALFADLQIRPLADTELEPTELVSISLGTSAAYVVGSPSGSVQLHDIPPQVTASGFAFETLPQGVQFDFSLDVSASLSTADIDVVDSNREPVPVDTVIYNAAANRASFNFAAPLPDGNYRANLLAPGVTHAMGEPLENDISFEFFVFAGDANRDRTVDIGDFAALALGFGAPGTFSQGNFNYDALVDIGDFAILASKFNTSLPAQRIAPAEASNGSVALSAPQTPFGGASRISRIFDELQNADAGLPA